MLALLLGTLLSAAGGAASAAEAEALSGAGPVAALRVCVTDANLPYANREGGVSGFDLDVAAAVAALIGYRVEPVWTGRAANIQEIEEDLPLARLARDDCDAMFSVPGPPGETLRGHQALVLGEPYYGAAFELVGCREQVPATLADLAGQAVAIQSQTVAHFALLAAGVEPRNYFSVNAAFDAARTHEAEAALLWGPAIGWRLRMAQATGLRLRDETYAACNLVAGYQPPEALRWNLHVATLRDRTRLRELVDDALATLTANGQLERIARGWGIPWHPPFATTYTRDALEALRNTAP